MGYSCTQAAMVTLEKTIASAQKENPVPESNTWIAKGNKFFYEIGREQDSGAITGKVMKCTVGNLCVGAGRILISPEGKVQKWAGMPNKFYTTKI